MSNFWWIFEFDRHVIDVLEITLKYIIMSSLYLVTSYDHPKHAMDEEDNLNTSRVSLFVQDFLFCQRKFECIHIFCKWIIGYNGLQKTQSPPILINQSKNTKSKIQTPFHKFKTMKEKMKTKKMGFCLLILYIPMQRIHMNNSQDILFSLFSLTLNSPFCIKSWIFAVYPPQETLVFIS